MEINKKRYRDFDSYMKEKFNKKIIKLSLDGGFTCPNRDGTISRQGCIFCSESGSGEWTYGKKTICEQMEYQKSRLRKTNMPTAYMAYFQNFTNTFGDINKLREIYYEALASDDIMGIAIATRADCLSDEVLELLLEIKEKYFLIVELGMQSVNEKTIELINRGYSHKTFDNGIRKLHKKGINTLVHMIVGLPYEDRVDFMSDITYINSIRPWGIKIHNLYIEKPSRLFDFYQKNDLEYGIEMEEYVEIVVDILRNLRPDIVINRLTGDGIGEKIAYPIWSKNKARILTSIDKLMKDKDYRQGDLWKEN